MKRNRLYACIGALLATISFQVEAVVIQGEWTPGVYPNVKIDSQGRLVIVNDSGPSGTQATATNNYLALIESKLPALNNGRLPVEFTTPVAVTGSVGIAGSVGVTGSVNATLIGTPTVTLSGTSNVNVVSGSIQAVPLTYAYRNITTNTTTTLKTGAGVLKRIVINTPGLTANVSLYDSTTGSGTKIANIVASAAGANSIAYELNFNTGLTVITTGGADITVVYN